MRSLLLPIDPAREDEAVDAAQAVLAAAGIDESDRGEFIGVQFGRWADGDGMDAAMVAVIVAALESGDPTFGGRLAGSYFELHDGLQTKHHLSFGQSSAFLSHARLAAHL